jgi:5-formyltetrahydrofolate cyclo-ligase
MSTDKSTALIRGQKQALRKEIRSKVRQLSRHQVQEQGNLVWNRLHELECYKKASSVGLFLSMPDNEINSDAAIAHAVRADKTIYVPQVGANFEQADMELRRVPSTTDERFHYSWPRNKWGIPEPAGDLPAAQPGDIDLVVVPGLAFDRAGNRLGQGKGYYDRFLELMCKDYETKPVLVAVGLDCQLVEAGSIPVHEHDFPVDYVLLPHETIPVYK